MQAHLVFQRYELSLLHIRRATRPYVEDYSGSKRHLLEQAIQELNYRYGDSYLLFIEDTSARIEALSRGADDVPGLEVKEWFERTSFLELDSELRKRHDRRATVTSDIALRIPGLDAPVLFQGSTSGRIAAEPSRTPTDERHPWLSASTFNGWFIPEGADRPLSDLSLEESRAFDFRNKSLEALAQRLSEYTAVLNVSAPQSLYRVSPDRSHEPPRTPSLFEMLDHPILVMGFPCSGKSTLGNYVQAHYAATWFEASDVLFDDLGFEEVVDMEHELGRFETAVRLLRTLGPDVVAHHILQQTSSQELRGFIVSGFRTLEEVLTFVQARPDSLLVWTRGRRPDSVPASTGRQGAGANQLRRVPFPRS